MYNQPVWLNICSAHHKTMRNISLYIYPHLDHNILTMLPYPCTVCSDTFFSKTKNIVTYICLKYSNLNTLCLSNQSEHLKIPSVHTFPVLSFSLLFPHCSPSSSVSLLPAPSFPCFCAPQVHGRLDGDKTFLHHKQSPFNTSNR